MKENSSNKPEISIVMPIYNEEKNIERYPKDLIEVLDKTERSYEIIGVDDGSTKDDSWGAIRKLAEQYPQVHAVKHSRNYGMGGAYQTGFERAKGEYIIIFSSDLEIPAENIEKVAQKMDEGFDVVNTNRTGRWKEDGWKSSLRRIPSNSANWMIEKISGVQVKDTGSGLKGFRRFIIDDMKIYGDMHRFLPAYSSFYTKRITEFEVEYKERTYGTPEYGSLKRTFSVFLDLFSLKFMLSFATKPFGMMPGRIFGTVGLISFGLGSLITLYLFFVKLFGENIGDRPLFIVGLLLIVMGIQLIMTGLLGELLMRIYFENRGTTPYIVSEEIS